MQRLLIGQFTGGLTILELLITIAVLALLATAGIGYYRSAALEVSSNSTLKMFVADIAAARLRAMAGDRGYSWGVRAHATDGTWEFFGTSTKDFGADQYMPDIRVLPTGMYWVDPASGVRDVTFAPIVGTTTPASFTLGVGNIRQRIDVDQNGSVVVTRL